MLHGPQLNLAAASLHTVTNHSSAIPGAPDPLMMFGFFSAVMLLGTFAIHEKSARLLAIRTVCLCALAVYGFAEGVWPLALAVSFMSIRESIRLRASIPGRWSVATSRARGHAMFATETRLARLFSDDNQPEIKPRTKKTKTKTKTPDDKSHYDDSMN